MDIRTEISGKTLYLEDMDGLTVTGSISSPTRITLSEQNGDTILSTIHYADFEGLIRLDLAKILKAYVVPRIPDDEWDSYTGQTLDLEFKVATTSYVQTFSFTLNCFSRDALTMMSDIDVLDVPMDDMLPLPVSVHSLGDTATIIRRRAKTEEELSQEECQDLGQAISSKMVYADTLHDDSQFCITVSPSAGTDMTSPIYRPSPGHFELFLFRNRFGAVELFPMSGNLHITPEYKFEVNRMGAASVSTLKSDSITLTQYTGPLSRQASKVLASMLADGYAFHYQNDDWRRIVITEADISLKKGDFVHRQNFSFRYQEPIEIRDIII